MSASASLPPLEEEPSGGEGRGGGGGTVVGLVRGTTSNYSMFAKIKVCNCVRFVILEYSSLIYRMEPSIAVISGTYHLVRYNKVSFPQGLLRYRI